MKAVPFTLLMMLCLPSQVSFDNPGMWYALAAGPRWLPPAAMIGTWLWSGSRSLLRLSSS